MRCLLLNESPEKYDILSDSSEDELRELSRKLYDNGVLDNSQKAKTIRARIAFNLPPEKANKLIMYCAEVIKENRPGFYL